MHMCEDKIFLCQKPNNLLNSDSNIIKINNCNVNRVIIGGEFKLYRMYVYVLTKKEHYNHVYQEEEKTTSKQNQN